MANVVDEEIVARDEAFLVRVALFTRPSLQPSHP
jgi:hypothetical protein